MNCAHGCGCQVEASQGFCSEHCQEHVATGPTGEPCGCGHPECRAS